MPKEQLLDYIDSTIAWAADIAEMWTGTLHADLIDNEQAQLIKAVEQEDYDKAYDLMVNLAQTLDYAEKAYREADER